MADSIHVDAATAAADSWLELDFADHAYVYVSLEIYIAAAQMVDWRTVSRGGPSNLLLLAGTGTTGNSGIEVEAVNLRDHVGGQPTYDSWQTDTFSDLVGGMAGGSWHVLQLVFDSGTANGSSLDADGTSVTGTNANATASHLLLGLANSFSGHRGELWLGQIKVGTSHGASNLLLFNPSTASDLSAFSATSGTVTLATAPTPPPSAPPVSSAPPVRVGLALAAAALDATPTWTYLDATAAVRVQDIQIKRGKADEREKTPTGTCTITGVDTGGILDPTNETSPYWDSGAGATKLNPMKQVQILLQHPISLDYFSLFRGFLSNLSYEIDPSEKFARFELECEDALAIFADAEVIPDVAGNTVPAESTGDVFYNGAQVDDRIKAALADAALSAGVTEWPTALMNIFSGNVAVQGSVYSARSPILGVLQEAAEGEYAGIPQLYVDKEGVVCFRGRETRFDPGTYHPSDNVRVPSQTILYWKIGDRAAFIADSDTVLLAEPFRFTRSKADLLNCALCLPKGIAEADIAGQFVTDATSVAAYGARSISFETLITEQGDEASPLDALAETKLFATYYVDNYKVPRNRPGQVTIKGQDPASSRGPKCWDLLCNIDLGDLPTLTTTHPGGGGFAGIDHFVEGVAYQIVPQIDTHPYVTLVADLVPRAYFATDPFPAHA